MKTIYFDTIPSTNLYLKENYNTISHLTTVTSKHQTNGRGRYDRKWIDNNDLLFSIILKEDLNNCSNYSLLIAYSIRKVLNKYLDNVTIKWPNDIMVKDKKICGILLEAVTKEKIECVIIGVGLNTNTESFSNELRVKATSLKNELNKEIDNLKLLEEIQTEFYNDYHKYKNDYSYINELNNYFYLTDKQVDFLYNGEKLSGIVKGINNDGSISIKVNNKLININYGEITLTNTYKVNK